MQDLSRDVVFTMLLHTLPRSLKSMALTNRVCHRIVVSDYFLSQYFSLHTGKDVTVNHKQLICPEKLALETPDNAFTVLLLSDTDTGVFLGKSFLAVSSRASAPAFITGRAPVNGCEQASLFLDNGREWQQETLSNYLCFETEYVLAREIVFLHHMHVDRSLDITAYHGTWRWHVIGDCCILLPVC